MTWGGCGHSRWPVRLAERGCGVSPGQRVRVSVTGPPPSPCTPCRDGRQSLSTAGPGGPRAAHASCSPRSRGARARPWAVCRPGSRRRGEGHVPSATCGAEGQAGHQKQVTRGLADPFCRPFHRKPPQSPWQVVRPMVPFSPITGS